MAVIVSLFLQYDVYEKCVQLLPILDISTHDCSFKFILTQKLFFNVDDFEFLLSVVCFCLKILTSPSHHLPRPQVREHFGVVVPSSYDPRRHEPPSHNQIS